MSTKFTPSADIDMSKEKEWSYGLGLLDWDNTNIVFTKRSLIEFLKYTGTTVDTNFSNISKLPRYAQVGKFTPRLGEEGASAGAEESTPSTAANDGDFKPTRRVRTAPGGPHTDIFGSDFQEEDDALARAPPSNATSPSTQHSGRQPLPEDDNRAPAASDLGEFKPSRRVREGPGGKDSISGLFG